ncbi:MAG: DPP IV N-terminal domain-containing protein, partial [Bacteroidetes bacterium]|nr:DPP IV N-terminal domain-containing protein [Bacteroidota bacterium]
IHRIEGTEGTGREHLFSPDGQRLAYTRFGNGGGFTVSVPRGLPEMQVETGRISYWIDDDSFVFVDPGGKTFIKYLSSNEVEEVDLVQGELEPGYAAVWKSLLPGTDVAFGHILDRTNPQGRRSILARVRMKDGSVVERLESPIMNPDVVGGGYLTYQQRNDTGELVVRPIHPETGDFLGPPLPVFGEEEAVVMWGTYSITPDGDLIYRNDSNSFVQSSESFWVVNPVTKEKTFIPLVMPPQGQSRSIELSADGERALMSIGTGGAIDIYLADISDTTLTQLTFSARASRASWMPGEQEMVFTETDGAVQAIYKKRVDAAAPAERILENGEDPKVSPDGKLMVFERTVNAGSQQLWILEMETGQEVAIDSTGEAVNMGAEFSPDSRYVAYVKQNVVWVASVDGKQKQPIPDVEGRYPRWTEGGRNLFIGFGNSKVVPVRTTPTFAITGAPRDVMTSNSRFGIDITDDGRKVVVVSTDVFFPGKIQDKDATELVWIQNWLTDLDRRFGR